MKCPLLHDVSARYCMASPHCRLPRHSISARDDRCTSVRYVDCPVLPADGVRTGLLRCPLLQEELVQFCAGVAVHKYIPYNEALLSRCNSEAHLYCPLYLARSRPHGRLGGAGEPAGAPEPPERLCYAPNHMWIDVAPDGSCHLGVDAFVSRVLGRVDRVRFLTGCGLQWPAAALETRHTNLRLVFPRRIHVSGSNVHLRSDPSCLLDDPYGAGWLYTGWATPGDLEEAAGEPDLIRDLQVPVWMRSEAERLDRFVRERLAATMDSTSPTAADGGSVVQGLAQHLDREGLAHLFHAFFALQGRKE